jgi:hypothetical protein
MEYVSGGTATHGHAEGGTFVMEGGFQRTQDRLDRERAEEKLFQEQHPISHVDPELLRLKAEVAAKKLERLKADSKALQEGTLMFQGGQRFEKNVVTGRWEHSQEEQ